MVVNTVTRAIDALRDEPVINATMVADKAMALINFNEKPPQLSERAWALMRESWVGFAADRLRLPRGDAVRPKSVGTLILYAQVTSDTRRVQPLHETQVLTAGANRARGKTGHIRM
jgi:hypothetical protein